MHAEPAAVCKTTSAPRGRYTPSVSPANDDETVTAVVSTLLTLALLLDVARLAGGPGRLVRCPRNFRHVTVEGHDRRAVALTL